MPHEVRLSEHVHHQEEHKDAHQLDTPQTYDKQYYPGQTIADEKDRIEYDLFKNPHAYGEMHHYTVDDHYYHHVPATAYHHIVQEGPNDYDFLSANEAWPQETDRL